MPQYNDFVRFNSNYYLHRGKNQMTMGKTVLGLALAALWLTGSAVMNAQEMEHQTLTGVVSNTHCGLKHSTANAADAGCVNSCAKGEGASYALVSGGKLIKLDGMAPELAKLAGLNAKVTGRLKGDSMHVEKVEAGK